MTPANAKEYIEHSPLSPGPIAPGLLGWLMPYDPPTVFCSVCIGRILARGIAIQALRNAAPIWTIGQISLRPEGVPCACCDTLIQTNI